MNVGYSPTASMVSFETWPLKVEAIDVFDGIAMVKANGKWFTAAEVKELDKALTKRIDRHATVQSFLRVPFDV